MMLYVIRHATAKSVGDAGVKKDFDRPLNDRGIAEAKKLAKYLRDKGIKFDLLLHSPTVRTTQTAKYIQSRVKCKEARAEELLSHNKTLADYLDALDRNADAEHLAFVGHNSMVSLLVDTLIGAVSGEVIHMKKGAIAIIEIPTSSQRGKRGELYVLIPPKALP